MENSNIHENNGAAAKYVIILVFLNLLSVYCKAQRVPEGYDCFQRNLVETFEIEKFGLDSLRVTGYSQGGISRNEPLNETTYVFKDSLLVEIFDRNCRKSKLEIKQTFQYDTLKRRMLWKYEDLMKEYSDSTFVHYKYSEDTSKPDSIFISDSRYSLGEGWDELVYRDYSRRRIKYVWRANKDTLTYLFDYRGDTTLVINIGPIARISSRVIWQQPRKPSRVEMFQDIFEYYWEKNNCSIYLTETNSNRRYKLQQAYMADSGLPIQMEEFYPNGDLFMIYFFEYFHNNTDPPAIEIRQEKENKRKCQK